MRPRLTQEEGEALIHEMADAGVEKINFVGGEPTIHPHIKELIRTAKKAGMTTSIVTNGSLIDEEWLTEMRPHLDWLGLSIDASNDVIHAVMGRGTKAELRKGHSSHLAQSLLVAEMADSLGYGLKLNTVVAMQNADDDMSIIVETLRPHRWKVFRVLEISDENDSCFPQFAIEDEAFDAWVDRHRHRLAGTGITMVVENNEDMLGTYAMVDPQGLVYTNSEGRYLYSQDSIVDIGFREAWHQVSRGFDRASFNARGGTWDWASIEEAGE